MNEILQQAERYWQHALYLGDAHYKASESDAKRHRLLGLPVVATTAIVSSSIFATLNSSPAVGWKIGAGLFSVAAAVLSALQTFFRFSEAAEQHKSAGAAYGDVRRRLEVFWLRYSSAGNPERGRALKKLEKIATRMSELAAGSPYLPGQFYETAVRDVRRRSGGVPAIQRALDVSPEPSSPTPP